MGSGGVAIAALPTVICLKVPFSDGLGGLHLPWVRPFVTLYARKCFTFTRIMHIFAFEMKP